MKSIWYILKTHIASSMKTIKYIPPKGILKSNFAKYLSSRAPISHYSGVIMRPMASQITGSSSVCPTSYSGVDLKKKHHSSASLAFVREIHRWPVNSPHVQKTKKIGQLRNNAPQNCLYENTEKWIFGLLDLFDDKKNRNTHILFGSIVEVGIHIHSAGSSFQIPVGNSYTALPSGGASGHWCIQLEMT